MKKKFLLITMITALVATMFTSGCTIKETAGDQPTDVGIYKPSAPTDGSLPTAHTGAENIGYVSSVLASQTQYNCYTYTVTTASIATQYTKSYKDYKDGVLISSDITYSTLVKSGTQTCTVNRNGKPEVYLRFSSAPSKTTDNLNANWNTTAPKYYDEDSYLHTYGLFQTELTNYIINPETLKDSGEVVVNGDGTYTQKYVLDPEASTYYYQYGMKTRGGLGSFPIFQTVEVTATFDSAWRVYELEINEIAKVNKGVTVTSTSTSKAKYSYGDESFNSAHFAFYDSYFKNHIGSNELVGSGEEELVLDTATVLSNGFSKVLGGGEQFEISLTLGEKIYQGYVYLSLSLEDLLGSLAVKLSLGESLEEQSIFIQFKNGEARAYVGENVSLGLNVAELNLVIDSFKEWVSGFENVIASLQDEGEEGDALSALLDQMLLEVGTTDATITLKTDDLLGFGVGVDASLGFELNGKEVSFASAKIGGLSVAGVELGLQISIPQTDEPEIVIDEKDYEDISAYAKDIYALLNSDYVKLSLSLNGNGSNISYLQGLQASACAYLDISGIALGAELYIIYEVDGTPISIKVQAYYDYLCNVEGMGDIYLSITEINGTPCNVCVKATGNLIYEGVSSAIAQINLQTNLLDETESTGLSIDISSIITNLLGVDFSTALDGLTAKEGKICINANIDDILSLLNIEVPFEFGNVDISYALSNESTGELKANLPALGLQLSVGAVDTTPIVKSEDYVDVNDLLSLVTSISQIIENVREESSVRITLNEEDCFITLGDLSLSIGGELEAVWAENVQVAFSGAIRSGEKSLDIKFVYDGSALSAPIVCLAINDICLEIYREDVGAFLAEIENIVSSIKDIIDGATNPNPEPQPEISQLSELVEEDISTLELVSAAVAFLSKFQILEKLNDINLSNGENFIDLKVLSALALSVSVEDGSVLNLNYALSSDKFSFGGNVKAQSALNGLFGEVTSKLQNGEYQVFASNEDIDFIKQVYLFVLGVVDEIDLSALYGEGSYSVQMILDGANSSLSALEGVFVQANVLVASGDVQKLHFIITINGVTVEASVAYGNRMLYIDLIQANGTALEGVKVSVSADGIYSAVENIVAFITETDVSALIELIKNNVISSVENVPDIQPPEITEENKTALKQMIYSFLTWESPVVESGLNELKVHVDDILSILGTNSEEVGTAYVALKDRGITLGCKLENSQPWVLIETGASNEEIVIEAESYIDIGFIGTIISDVKNTVIENGAIRKLYTFRGADREIRANLSLGSLSLADIKITDVTITGGFDSNDEFFATFTGKLVGGSLATLVIQDNYIMMNFTSGYVTIGKGETLDNMQYRMMSTEYFGENVLKYDSPISWLLGASDLLWKTIVDSINSDSEVNSLYLYELPKEEQDAALSQFINGLRVVLGGEEVSVAGNGCECASQKLSVEGDYYMIDLNADAMTEGVLKTLYAAILRDERGISGIKAFGNVASILDFSVQLSFEPDTLSHAENYKNIVVNGYETGLPELGEDEIYGCYDSSTDSVTPYEKPLSYTVTVFDRYGNYVEYKDVKKDTIVYVYDPALSPIITENGKSYCLIASTEMDGEVAVVEEIVITSDIIVRPYYLNVVTLHLVNCETDVTCLPETFALPVLESTQDSTFMGWYVDGDLTKRITTVPEGVEELTIHAVFADSEVVVNGIKYTANGELGAYFVSGFESIPECYTKTLNEGGEYLVIESSINSLPVTYIASNALAKANLKNVVVPKTVVEVYDRAFLDNYGIERVIFLAPTVTLYGKDSEQNTPFYGCSVSASSDKNQNEVTALHVYYNEIIYNDGTYWTHFRKVVKVITFNFYVSRDGGGKHEGGTWAFVEYQVEGYQGELTATKKKVIDADISADELKNSILFELDNFTSQNYIKAYEVECGDIRLSDAESGHIKAIVTVREKAPLYKLVDERNEFAKTATVMAIDGEYTEYNGNIYVASGAKISLSLVDETNFSVQSWVFIDSQENSVSFDMPSQPFVISCPQITASDISAKFIGGMEVSFTYGENTTVGESVEYTFSAGTLLSKVAVQKEGYAFIGWAIYADERMILQNIEQSVTANAEYYAIWARATENVTFNVSDNAITATLNSANCTIYGWYTDEAFTQGYVAGNAVEIGISQVYCVRMFYTFTYKVSGRLVTTLQSSANGETKGRSSFSYKFTVLEGQVVKAIKTSDKVVAIYVDGELKDTLTLVKYFGVQYSFKPDRFSNDEWLLGEISSSNCSVEFKY